jgi:hypothetical protein
MLFQPAEINHTPKIVPNKHPSKVKDQLFQDRKVIPDGSFLSFKIKGRKMFTFQKRTLNTECTMIWIKRSYCYFELKEKQ